MIKIKRTVSDIPEVNNRQNHCKLNIATEALKALFIADSASYSAGSKTFKFFPSIYGDKKIKEKLRLTQFGKCAFCESNIIHIDYGDVEHYRPKGGFKQKDKSVLQKPGYYWLAYDWNNLILSCSICNQQYKKNLFPLRNPEVRALNHYHLDKLRCEKPFIINPVKENPKFLIKFDGATAIGIDKNHRGKKTIEALGLNRSENGGLSQLFEMRNDHYKTVQSTFDIANSEPHGKITKEKIDLAKALIKELQSKKKKFSAMIRDNFPLNKFSQ